MRGLVVNGIQHKPFLASVCKTSPGHVVAASSPSRLQSHVSIDPVRIYLTYTLIS